MLERPVREGEVLVTGEASPRRHGPFRLDGRYRVSFAQYAPEAPHRGFADQVPFVATLRAASNLRNRPIVLFHEAARRGSRTVRLHGTYAVEVLFGDFPYVIRLSPLPA
jgi:hypothetical protein